MKILVARWPALLLFSGLLILLSAPAALAQQMSVTPVSAEVSVQDTTLQATFKIEVVNSESSPMTNFFVFFEDGTYISIGDVDAGATVVSDTVTRSVDLSDRPASRTQPLPVTLKFSFDGQNLEKPWQVGLHVSE